MRAALFALACLATPAQAQGLFDATAGLDLQPCEMSSLSCTTLTLPLDHAANDPSRTIDITFALSFASIESQGIMFYFVGGPGVSGISAADSILGAFDESVLQYLDVVFVDQRGTGPDHGMACPTVQAGFDLADMSLSRPDDAIAAARDYVLACTAEIGRPDLLPYVNSDQAIRDSEAFRQLIGAPKVWMYGESYGTQFVQAYATQFPQAVRGVILDGVVDLNLDAPGFYTSYTLAAESLLDRMLAECALDADCARDMGGDAARVYDDLIAQLDQAPLPVSFVRSDGSTEERLLTAGQVQSSAIIALYSPEGRADFLRTLAAAARGNHLPLLHLAYYNNYIDADTRTPVEDEGWFAAAFFAITCTDYDSGAGQPEDRARAILQQARDFAPNAPRLLRAYMQEQLACAFWPHQGPSVRPAPYAGGAWPTLILNSDSDPITPITMAYSVLDSARNAYGVFLKGGPHVIWGRGNACPDSILYDLILDGTLPAQREQHCEQSFLADYTPLTLTDPGQMADPLSVARALQLELGQSYPLAVWDGLHPMTLGCDFGGTMTVMPTESGTGYSFQDCRPWPALAINGRGADINLGEPDDSLTFDIAVSGPSSGEIRYRFAWRDETWSLSGVWDGRPAMLPRLAP